MMIAMAGLQVFIVRFFFQVRYAVVIEQGICADMQRRVRAKVTYKETTEYLMMKLLHWKDLSVDGISYVYFYMKLTL